MNSRRGYECVFGIVLVHSFSVCSLASVLLYGMIYGKGAHFSRRNQDFVYIHVTKLWEQVCKRAKAWECLYTKNSRHSALRKNGIAILWDLQQKHVFHTFTYCNFRLNMAMSVNTRISILCIVFNSTSGVSTFLQFHSFAILYICCSFQEF